MQSVQVNVVAATFVGGAYIGEGSPKLAVIGIVSKILSVHAKCYLSVTYRSGCIPMARSSGCYYHRFCHQRSQAKTAILMHNMGDSHHTEDVAAYLQRVFTDKDIMSLPFQREGIRQVVVFSQYPHYSCCTTGSNLNAMCRFYTSHQLPSTAKWIFIDRWPLHSAITQAYADIIKEQLKRFPEDVRQQVVLLFSAHSLPMKASHKIGDTYPAEVAATVVSIMNKLDNSHPYRLVWQSKAVQRCLLQVGRLPWLKPETEDTMRALAKEGHRHVMLVPVSFVNEHVETLHEMDIELGQELAPKGLADLVCEHLRLGLKCSPQLLLPCPMCTSDTCRQMRKWVQSLP
ncbi:hypothetical protein HPB48_023841 [Haemaphysalis longicornis]|uniref:Ferrochelatase n=1 Tax=Haemaphysalis longicornis TaxID=44386 RepID=A0A9J6H7T3_HAELO|nr:hypothetical protein HPB48_023841 [Haemaphysalis longicornis]